MYILRLRNQWLDFNSYGSHGQQHDMQTESLITKRAEGLGFAAAAAKPRPLGEVQNLQPNSRSPRVRGRSWASLEVVTLSMRILDFAEGFGSPFLEKTLLNWKEKKPSFS